MASTQKLDKEMARKAKQQQKRQRKLERRRATKLLPTPGAIGPVSPFADTQSGAMTGD